MIKALRRFLKDNKTRPLYDRVEKQIRKKAQLMGDLEYHRTMSNFYTDRVLEIDHNTDWWNFAEAKQKQADHQEDFLAYENKIKEADAKVQAANAALEKHLHELNTLPK